MPLREAEPLLLASIFFTLFAAINEVHSSARSARSTPQPVFIKASHLRTGCHWLSLALAVRKHRAQVRSRGGVLTGCVGSIYVVGTAVLIFVLTLRPGPTRDSRP